MLIVIEPDPVSLVCLGTIPILEIPILVTFVLADKNPPGPSSIKSLRRNNDVVTPATKNGSTDSTVPVVDAG